MTLLLIGLFLFLGIHSVRIFANDWRSKVIATRGGNAFKGLYSILSAAGLVLIILGYSLTRADPVYIWHPPAAMMHIAALLTLIAFVLLAAAYVPGNRIKSRIGHPMVVGVKVWAFAHLLANGRLGDILLFGSFFIWAISLYNISRRRDRSENVEYLAAVAGVSRDAMTVVLGVGAWLVFSLMLHLRLIGVHPFGG